MKLPKFKTRFPYFTIISVLFLILVSVLFFIPKENWKALFSGQINNLAFSLNPPSITSLSITSRTVGDPGFSLTVNGSNFSSGYPVRFNGSNRSTTFVSSNQLIASILTSDLSTFGSFSINVSSALGSSNSKYLSVNYPINITSINPTSVLVGQSFNLTINGTGLSGASGNSPYQVSLSGPTSYSFTPYSSSQTQLLVGVSPISSSGNYNVIVYNPDPGGAGSNAKTLNVFNPNPVPVITNISPSSKIAGQAGFTMTVNGTGFVNGSSVRFNGLGRSTTFVSSTQLTAQILSSDLASAGAWPITVYNPSPGGGVSNSQTFFVAGVPHISSISPSTKTAGDPQFTLTINGSNFTGSNTVSFNGQVRLTNFISSNQLQVTILSSDISAAGTFPVYINNPSSDNVVFLSVNNSAPYISSIDPISKTAGDSQFTLTVNGANFVSSSLVRFNGLAKTTTLVSSTTLTAVIPSADLNTAGTYSVTVTNPTPGGGTSSTTFTVNNPTPITSSINPTSKTVGDSQFTMIVDGSGFSASSVVQLNGVNKSTTFVSSAELTSVIETSDLTAPGTFSITVLNPATGNISNPQTFVVNNITPSIASINPNSKIVGDSQFILTVNGNNFNNSSRIQFNGSDRATIFSSSTELTAVVLDSDLASPGTFSITVANPPPGGGTSIDSQTFIVNNPVPSISNIDTILKLVNDPQFTLIINGSNFIGSSIAQFNGSDRATIFSSSTELSAMILSSDLSTAGIFPITVINPTPGGGQSNPKNFTVHNPSHISVLITPPESEATSTIIIPTETVIISTSTESTSTEPTTTPSSTSTPTTEATSSLPAGFCFTKNLHPYTSDPDTKYLQELLNNLGFNSTAKGSENNYYGTETVNAVTAFQEFYAKDILEPFGLTSGTGVFGNATRKEANDSLGCQTALEVSPVVSSMPSASTTPTEENQPVIVPTTTPNIEPIAVAPTTTEENPAVSETKPEQNNPAPVMNNINDSISNVVAGATQTYNQTLAYLSSGFKIITDFIKGQGVDSVIVAMVVGGVALVTAIGYLITVIF